MQVTQISIGRFHHFHLARQLEKAGLLGSIWTGYPLFKLRDELGIPASKIKSFPYVQTLFMAKHKFGALNQYRFIDSNLSRLAQVSLDMRVALSLREPSVVVALSGQGLKSGSKAKSLGGGYVCDRGSTHVRHQARALTEEAARWKVEVANVDDWKIEREELEYEHSDVITVPSDFCRETFISNGVAPPKIKVVPYGGRLERFHPVSTPDAGEFTVLFVGGLSLRKGIPYLFEAFKNFSHPRKKLKLIGQISPEIRDLVKRMIPENTVLLGNVPNNQLAAHYSSADVLVLPSIEEGLAMVMAEALACGCPVVATPNTGAANLFEHGKHGLIIEVRSSEAIRRALEEIASNSEASVMRSEAAAKIVSIGGWDRYGENFKSMLKDNFGQLL